jgi:cellobiose transport system substrate-binding protein
MSVHMRAGKRSRVTAAAGAAMAVALLAAGCGSSDNASKASADDPNAPVTLSVGLFGTFGFKEAGLYDQYMKLHPNVKIVEHSVEQSADYYKALQTHLAANSGLDDIQGLEIGFVADVVKNHANQFVDMSKVDGGSAALKNFYDWKVSQATAADGRVVGLGTDAGPEAICYRKDLFQKAGLPSDRTQVGSLFTDWNSFINAGKQYEASATKQANSHFLDSSASIFSAAVYQGDTAYDDAKGNPIPATSDGVKSAWGYASTAASAGITAGLQQFSDAWNSAFSNGAFAALACPAWMTGYITSQAGDAGKGQWDIATLPGESQAASNWGGSWLGVPTASKHQKAAEQLVQWLTAPEQQVTMFTSQGHFPSSSVAAADPKVASATSDYFSGAPIGKIYGETADKIKRTPIGPYDTQIQQAFTTALTNVEAKKASPDDALKQAQSAAKDAIGG